MQRIAWSVFVVAAGALITIGCANGDAGEGDSGAERRPNVIVIVADDLGYGDVCCLSCQGLATPNIDSIASAGVRFTDGHVTAPVCSPSRAGFMTGRYQQRFGHEFNAGAAERCERMGLGLPTTETTLTEVMKAAGYVTGMVGKWHLGSNPQFHPQKRGFDEFFGFLHGGNLYMDPHDQPGVHNATVSDERFGGRRTELNPILRGTDPVVEEQYLTDAFTREAVAFIERHRSEPFFLYVPYNAPHTPLQATDEYYQRFPDIADERKRIYAAMVSALDDGVGEILESLKRFELWNDTLVVFFSDNGCATYTNACYNDPLLGGKLTLFEGGQRIPYLMQLPGVLPAGATYDRAVSTLDIFPTVATLAGAELPPGRDGVDLVPFLTGRKEGDPHEALFWRNGTNSAVRKGRWKLVNLGEGEHVLLYDVVADIGETNDLAAAHPEVLDELSGLLERWQSELVDPLWPTRRVIPIEIEGLKIDLFV
jgi:arylsulfatase A-like enzyme